MLSFINVAATFATVTANQGFVTLPFERVSINASTSTHEPAKRELDPSPHDLPNKHHAYIATFYLGTPEQKMKAIVDTGSADLWVYGGGASYNYNPSSSSSSLLLNNDFNIMYADGNTISGSYYTDVLSWGSATVTAQFALADTFYQAEPTGTFGVALRGSEATSPGERYDNYPFALKKAGLIESAAFSLFLNDFESHLGTIVFGALDKSRFTGPMSILPLLSNNSFIVETSVRGKQFEAALDSGSSLTYLPDDFVAQLAQDLGATWDSDHGAFAAPFILPDDSITYTFGNTNINVPPSELWGHVRGSLGLCLTILPSSQAQGDNILGESFLRSAYVVYDLDNLSVGIAQANWDPEDPEYEVIPIGGIVV